MSKPPAYSSSAGGVIFTISCRGLLPFAEECIKLVKGRWGIMQTSVIHELVMLTLNKCHLHYEGKDEEYLAREIYEKYIKIQTAIIAEATKPKSK
ncbi:hypothetical protein [Sporomusa paucivorans]|uniref:hypothetical protein n=1 Tax=Sporomusa paucivorans TaxID=2376 RepID=UPI0035713483